MTLYIILFFMLSILAGRSLLRLIGIAQSPTQQHALGPIAFAILTTLVLSIGISLGINIKPLSYIVWLMLVVASLDGLRNLELGSAKGIILALLSFCILTALLVPALWHTLSIASGAEFDDKWFYIAKGQYFWDSPASIVFDSSPFYRMGALYPFRYASSILLSFISVLATPQGDIFYSAGYYLAWCVFLYGASILYFAVSCGLFKNGFFIFCYLLMTVASTWTLNLLLANNFDNILSLQILPVMAGFIMTARPKNNLHAGFFGALCAFSVYVYFESSIIILAGGMFFILGRALTDDNRKDWLQFLGIALMIFCFLLLPAFKDMLAMYHIQIESLLKQNALRPGSGYFPGFMSSLNFVPTYLGNILALDRLPTTFHDRVVLFSYASFAWIAPCVFVGLRFLLRTRQFGLSWYFIALLALQIATILFIKYDYGAYKVIVMSWWLFSLCAILGIQQLSNGSRRKTIAAGVAVLSIFAFTLHCCFENARVDWTKTISSYKSLRELAANSSFDSILVDLLDKRKTPLIACALRSNKFLLSGPEYPLFSDFTTNGLSLKDDISKSNSILSDAPDYPFSEALPVWNKNAFYLFSFKHPRVLLDAVINLNGVDTLGGRPWYWVGNGLTVLDVYADYAGEARMTAAVEPGPAVADPASASLTVLTENNFSSTVAVPNKIRLSLNVPVKPGKNRILLSPKAIIDSSKAPAGDPRKILLGVHSIYFTAIQ